MYIYLYIYICTYGYTHIYVHVYVYIHICICACTAVRCSVLHLRCSVWFKKCINTTVHEQDNCVWVCCGVLQYVAVYYGVLQCVIWNRTATNDIYIWCHGSGIINATADEQNMIPVCAWFTVCCSLMQYFTARCMWHVNNQMNTSFFLLSSFAERHHIASTWSPFLDKNDVWLNPQERNILISMINENFIGRHQDCRYLTS